MAFKKNLLQLALIPVSCLALYVYLRFFSIIRDATSYERPGLGISKAIENRPTSTAIPDGDVYIRPYDYEVEMERLISLKVEADDSRLIFLIKKFYIEAPSVFPYNLTKPDRQDFSQGGQSTYVDNLLEHRGHGFFIECGAYDGEKLSASLLFEKYRQWTGLLIEANPYEFNKLRFKHRKSFIVNACLSKYPYPTKMSISLSGVYSRVKEDLAPGNQSFGKKLFASVQCFPLYSILLAIGRTSVDYFTLDIEGDELFVLRAIPWDKVDIKMLVVEYNHIPEGRQALIDFMAARDYISLPIVHKYGWQDVVFIKNGFNYNKTFTA